MNSRKCYFVSDGFDILLHLWDWEKLCFTKEYGQVDHRDEVSRKLWRMKSPDTDTDRDAAYNDEQIQEQQAR